MRRTYHTKALAGILVAAAMLSTLTACGDKPKEQENTEATTSEGTTSEGTDEGTSQQTSATYSQTEENENKELVMNRQPEASYWFPAQLLEWSPDTDEDLIFNLSTVPLAERVPVEELEAVNQTQNKDTKVPDRKTERRV